MSVRFLFTLVVVVVVVDRGKFYVYHYTLSEPPDLTCPRVSESVGVMH